MPEDKKNALDPKVGDALLNDDSVMEIMTHPKMADALKALKEDPSAYQGLVESDPVQHFVQQLGLWGPCSL